MIERVEVLKPDTTPRMRKGEWAEICKEQAAKASAMGELVNGRAMTWKEWADKFGHKFLREEGLRAPVARYRVTDLLGKFKPLEVDCVDESEARAEFYKQRGVKQPSKCNCNVVCIEGR